jgi:hypothetical protein
MAAYEDFEFFRTAKWRAAAAAASAESAGPASATPSVTASAGGDLARDALRSELVRLHATLRRLRARHRVERRTRWPLQIRRIVRSLLPGARGAA